MAIRPVREKEQIDVIIEAELEKLATFSEEDRKLADETYSCFRVMFETATTANSKVSDAVIMGLNQSLKLKIESTQRLSKIVDQLIRLRGQMTPKVGIPSDVGDYKKVLEKIHKEGKK